MLTPAFLLPEVVLDFFERVISQYFSRDDDQVKLEKFDILNARAPYQNYAVENVRHTCHEIKKNVKAERCWLKEKVRSNCFVMFLYTKIYREI
jgi:hypothetical protein